MKRPMSRPAVAILSSLMLASAALAASINPPTTPQTSPAMNDKEKANLKMVLDWWREVIENGHMELTAKYQAEDYIQHNPNAAQGLAGLVDYVRASRPVREISNTLDLPLVHLMAEGDYVATTFVRPENDAAGETYYSSWFDLYRIEAGKIAEHWDPMLKSDPKIDPNDKRL